MLAALCALATCEIKCNLRVSVVIDVPAIRFSQLSFTPARTKLDPFYHTTCVLEFTKSKRPKNTPTINSNKKQIVEGSIVKVIL